MIRHKQQILSLNPRVQLEKVHSIWENDGVSSIEYKVAKRTLYSGFTHFLFDIGNYQLQDFNDSNSFKDEFKSNKSLPRESLLNI